MTQKTYNETIMERERARKNAGGEDLSSAAGVSKALEKISAEIKNFHDDANKEIKATGKLSEETKARVDEALKKQGELLETNAEFAARLTELEQKGAREPGDAAEQESIGHKFVNSDEFKAFQNMKGKGKMAVGFKAVTNITNLTTGTGAAGDLVRPDRLQAIVAGVENRLTVRDLITPGTTSSNAISYVKETGFQNMAAIQAAQGDAKAQSDIAFDEVISPVATIAHFARISKQMLDDAPALASYIDGRLKYGLKYKEDQQLLMGSGVSGELNGIYTQATAYSNPIASLTDPTMIDLIRLAMLQAEIAQFAATGTVLNYADWAYIELMKDDVGRYIIGNPQDSAQPRLWGRPVVPTAAMTIDKFLVGAFKQGAQVFDREDANVQLSTEDADNFTKNLVTARAEERLALAVYRPEAFIKGDLGLV